MQHGASGSRRPAWPCAGHHIFSSPPQQHHTLCPLVHALPARLAERHASKDSKRIDASDSKKEKGRSHEKHSNPGSLGPQQNAAPQVATPASVCHLRLHNSYLVCLRLTPSISPAGQLCRGLLQCKPVARRSIEDPAAWAWPLTGSMLCPPAGQSTEGQPAVDVPRAVDDEPHAGAGPGAGHRVLPAGPEARCAAAHLPIAARLPFAPVRSMTFADVVARAADLLLPHVAGC